MKRQKIFSFAMFLAAAFVVCGLTAQYARADHSGADFNQFQAKVRAAQAGCVRGEACKPQGFEFKNLYSGDGGDARVTPLMPGLFSIAQDQATIWADTILEGFFDADGNTRLDSVDAVYQDGKVVAYHIVYSERAWRIGDGGERVEQGRIKEASYVSAGMTSWFRDEFGYAIFE